VYSDLKLDIIDSINDIDDLLTTYEQLFERVKQNEPDKIELAALGTVLHSFYNGVDGIFILISKKIDNKVPSDSTWHQALLNNMVETTVNRKHLISHDTALILAPYLKFRHFFRHAYAFMLDWKRIKPLFDELISVWDKTKLDITAFCNTIN